MAPPRGLRSVAVLLVGAALLTEAGCAPSAELRIPVPEAPLVPGRLVVMPVGAEAFPTLIAAEDVPEQAGFASVAEHEAAFWSAFTAELDDALRHVDVRLGGRADRSAFEARRVLLQGEDSGYGRARWTVETMALPTSVDFDSLGAEYVLFVETVRATTDLGRHTLSVPLGRLALGMSVPARGVGVSARFVLVQAGREGPILAHMIGGAEGGDGLLGTGVNRDVWRQAVARLASTVAERASGRGG